MALSVALQVSEAGKHKSLTKPVWTKMTKLNPTVFPTTPSTKEEFIEQVRCAYDQSSSITWTGINKHQISSRTPFSPTFDIPVGSSSPLQHEPLEELTLSNDEDDDDPDTEIEADSSNDDDEEATAAAKVDEQEEAAFIYKRPRRDAQKQRKGSLYDYTY